MIIEKFAFPLENVEEVIRNPKTVKVPCSPVSLNGVANLRGEVLPVVSLRRLFRMKDLEDELSRVVVCSLEGHKMGFLVDRVHNVLNIEESEIEEEEEIKTFLRREFIKSMIKEKRYGTIILLEIERLLEEEYSIITERRSKQFKQRAEIEEMRKLKEEGRSRELVVFQLVGEEYGIDIGRVREIIQFENHQVIRVPGSKEYVLGVINYRGGVLPLISFRRFFNKEDEEGVRVVVLSEREFLLGLVVDSVREVMGVQEKDIEPISKVLASSSSYGITEVCRIEQEKRLIFLFSPKVFFSDREVKEMAAREEKQAQGELSMEEEIQVVVFKVSREDYAVDINRVQEIVRVPEEITHVPKAPDFMEGVINLRGHVLPVVSMRRLFGFLEEERNDRQRILVLRILDMNIGFLVDTVSEVLKVSKKLIQLPPKLSSVQEKLFVGVINLEAQRRIIQLLNVDALLNYEELLSLRAGYEEEGSGR